MPCSTCGSNDHSTSSHVVAARLRPRLQAEVPQRRGSRGGGLLDDTDAANEDRVARIEAQEAREAAEAAARARRARASRGSSRGRSDVGDSEVGEGDDEGEEDGSVPGGSDFSGGLDPESEGHRGEVVRVRAGAGEGFRESDEGEEDGSVPGGSDFSGGLDPESEGHRGEVVRVRAGAGEGFRESDLGSGVSGPASYDPSARESRGAEAFDPGFSGDYGPDLEAREPERVPGASLSPEQRLANRLDRRGFSQEQATAKAKEVYRLINEEGVRPDLARYRVITLGDVQSASDNEQYVTDVSGSGPETTTTAQPPPRGISDPDVVARHYTEDDRQIVTYRDGTTKTFDISSPSSAESGASEQADSQHAAENAATTAKRLPAQRQHGFHGVRERIPVVGCGEGSDRGRRERRPGAGSANPDHRRSSRGYDDKAGPSPGI